VFQGIKEGRIIDTKFDGKPFPDSRAGVRSLHDLLPDRLEETLLPLTQTSSIALM
jgi:hypothetical protein